MKPRKHGHIPSKTGTRFPRWLNDDSMVWNHSHMAIRNSRLEWETQKKKNQFIHHKYPRNPKKSNIASFPTAGNQGLWWLWESPCRAGVQGRNARGTTTDWAWKWSVIPTLLRDCSCYRQSFFWETKNVRRMNRAGEIQHFFELDYRLPKCINIDTMKIHQKRRYCFWGNHGFSYCRC